MDFTTKQLEALLSALVPLPAGYSAEPEGELAADDDASEEDDFLAEMIDAAWAADALICA